MPDVREQVPLSGFTTLGLGGPARRFVVAGTDDELIAAVRAADDRGEPLLILGGGSNLVIADEGFPGTVIQVATAGITRRTGPRMAARPRSPWPPGRTGTASSPRCVAAGLAGLECLSGIPGLAGATPIQNVGAYGQEVAETITTVRVYDRKAGEVADLAAADCGFGYRTSAFKRDASGTGIVVLAVTFQLARDRLSGPGAVPGTGPRPRRGRGRPGPARARSARPCSGCAGARACCWTPGTRTAAAPGRSSPTRCWTARSSPRCARRWTGTAAPGCRSRSSRPGPAR